jgi:hypothetical protein
MTPKRRIESAIYHRTRTGAMEETICAENNIAFDASVEEVSMADKPDF